MPRIFCDECSFYHDSPKDCEYSLPNLTAIDDILVFGPESKALFSKKAIDAQIAKLVSNAEDDVEPAQYITDLERAAKYRVIAILNGEYKSLTIRKAWLQLEGRDTHDDMTTVINRLYAVDTMARQYTFELVGRDMF
jgi:hypothetical protein